MTFCQSWRHCSACEQAAANAATAQRSRRTSDVPPQPVACRLSIIDSRAAEVTSLIRISVASYLVPSSAWRTLVPAGISSNANEPSSADLISKVAPDTEFGSFNEVPLMGSVFPSASVTPTKATDPRPVIITLTPARGFPSCRTITTKLRLTSMPCAVQLTREHAVACARGSVNNQASRAMSYPFATARCILVLPASY